MSLSARFQWWSGPGTVFQAQRARFLSGLATALLGLCLLVVQTAEIGEARAETPESVRLEHPGSVGRLPAGFLTARVFDDASLAGQRAVVTEVRAALSAPLASAQLAAAWRVDPSVRVIEHRHGVWHLVSRLGQGTLEVLQIQPDGPHARGFLTIWRSAAPAQPFPVARLLPAGFRPGQAVTLDEGARRITGFVAEADGSVKLALDHLQKHWRNQGLRAVFSSTTSDPLHDRQPSILRFQGGPLELTALVIPQAEPPQFVITVSEPRP